MPITRSALPFFYLMLGILYLYLSDSQQGGMGWTGSEANALITKCRAYLE
jgi:hypothetical protein